MNPLSGADARGGGDARLRAVAELARSVAAARDSTEACLAAARHARLALGGSMSAISRWERDHGRLRVLVNDGDLADGEELRPRHEVYPVADFPETVGFVHARWPEGGEPRAWVETADAGPAAWRRPGAYRHRKVAELRRRGRSCCVVAPITLHGLAWGELYVARDAGQPVFDRADEEFATVLGALIAVGVAQCEQLTEVRRLAFTDPLTGLGNRRSVDARLDEALERYHAEGVPVSLVVCDLNGLKRVNDEMGHDVGDRLLVSFGSVLSLCAAALPGSLAARLGGDEFCLLATGHPAGDVEKAAGELCERARWLGLGDGVAVGVASTDAPIGPVVSGRRLLRLADAAQYRAKALRSPTPVVAGRGAPRDPVVRLADQPPPRKGDRRRFRGQG